MKGILNSENTLTLSVQTNLFGIKFTYIRQDLILAYKEQLFSTAITLQGTGFLLAFIPFQSSIPEGSNSSSHSYLKERNPGCGQITTLITTESLFE